MIFIPNSIFLDFDNTLVNSSEAVCRLYNIDYYEDPKFVEAKSENSYLWSFADVCPLLDTPIKYFNNPRLFEILRPFEDPTVIHNLSLKIQTYIVTMGSPENIKLKTDYMRKFYPNIDTLYISNLGTRDINKKIINMEDSIFVDDLAINLENCNAKHKYIFGSKKDYNNSNKYERIHSIENLMKRYEICLR